MRALRLVLHELRFAQKVFWRNPASVFFTVLLPVIFLLIFATIFGNDPIEALGNVPTSTYYVPAIVTLAVVSATMVSLSINLVSPARPACSSADVARRSRRGSSSPAGSATRS